MNKPHNLLSLLEYLEELSRGRALFDKAFYTEQSLKDRFEAYLVQTEHWRSRSRAVVGLKLPGGDGSPGAEVGIQLGRDRRPSGQEAFATIIFSNDAGPDFADVTRTFGGEWPEFVSESLSPHRPVPPPSSHPLGNRAFRSVAQTGAVRRDLHVTLSPSGAVETLSVEVRLAR